MHSSSRAIILATDDLSAPDKDRSDHGSIADKGEVSSTFTFVFFFVFRQGSSQQINSENQIQTKKHHREHLSLTDAIMLNVSICIPPSLFFTRVEQGEGNIYLSCSWQSPLKWWACWGLRQQDDRNLFLILLWQQMQIAWLSPRRENESGRWENAEKEVCKKRERDEQNKLVVKQNESKSHSSILWSILMTSSSALPSKYYINNLLAKN